MRHDFQVQQQYKLLRAVADVVQPLLVLSLRQDYGETEDLLPAILNSRSPRWRLNLEAILSLFGGERAERQEVEVHTARVELSPVPYFSRINMPS